MKDKISKHINSFNETNYHNKWALNNILGELEKAEIAMYFFSKYPDEIKNFYTKEVFVQHLKELVDYHKNEKEKKILKDWLFGRLKMAKTLYIMGKSPDNILEEVKETLLDK